MKWFEKLLDLREQLGYKQGEFASILGTSQKELSMLETGKKSFIPKWYMSYLLNNDYDFNSLYKPHLNLVKIEFNAGICNENDVIEYILNNFQSLSRNPKFAEIVLKAVNTDKDGEESITSRITRLEAVVGLNIIKGNLITTGNERQIVEKKEG